MFKPSLHPWSHALAAFTLAATLGALPAAHAGVDSIVTFTQAGQVDIVLTSNAGGFDHILEPVLVGGNAPFFNAVPFGFAWLVGTENGSLLNLVGDPDGPRTPTGFNIVWGGFGLVEAGQEISFRLTNLNTERIGGTDPDALGERPGWSGCLELRPTGWRLGLQPKMGEDLLDHRLLPDRRDDLQRAAAGWAMLHVDLEHPLGQLGPAQPHRAVVRTTRLAVDGRCGLHRRLWLWRHWILRHCLGAQLGVACQLLTPPKPCRFVIAAGFTLEVAAPVRGLRAQMALPHCSAHMCSSPSVFKTLALRLPRLPKPCTGGYMVAACIQDTGKKKGYWVSDRCATSCRQYLVPEKGVEPSTFALRMRCSTN